MSRCSKTHDPPARPFRRYGVVRGVLVLCIGATACADVHDEEVADSLRPAQDARYWDTQPADTVPGFPSWTGEDLRLLSEKLSWGWEQGLDGRPLGEAMVAMGRSFLGTPYTPQTLEAPGEERLVVNLRELDCVTFVETVLALNRVLRSADSELLDDPSGLMSLYEEVLTGIRYRNGRLDGYGSRLHYFSEWIADNDRRGTLRAVTAELGGVEDPEPIDFMSTHPDAYRQLSDPGVLAQVVATESDLNASGRRFVPEEAIAGVEARIQDGDIIAATSTVGGLDVAHTGIALRIDGTLHLMHAPLVGKDVQISEQSLSERILRIESQDGIMVARPVDPDR